MRTIKLLFFLAFACLTSCQSEAQTSNDQCQISKTQLSYLNDNLSQAATSVRDFNQSLFERIVIEVANKGNRSTDVEITDKADEIRKLTDLLFDNLNKIKAELAQGLDASESVGYSNKVIFEQGNGHQIKELLDTYIDSKNNISNSRHQVIFPELGTEYNEIELFFKNSTVAGSIGTITAFQTQASNIESYELFNFAKMTGTR